MKLIDFDGRFDACLQQWYQDNFGKYRTYDEMEEQAPEVYQRFLDTPADWLDGAKPGEYFERFDDPRMLVDWLRAYEESDVPTPDMLLNRISELGETATEPLMALLRDEQAPQAARMAAMTLLGEIGSAAPAALYADWLARWDGKDELGESALEGLEGLGEEAAGEMLRVLPDATDEGRYGLLSVLSNLRFDRALVENAVELFERRPDLRVQLAAVLGRFGDDFALSALKKAAASEETGYLTFIELRSAIEALGGEAPRRRFSDDDPEYEAMRALEARMLNDDPQ